MTSDYKLISINELSKNCLKEFDCGTVELNEFLTRYALKNDNLGIGKTFVALDSKEKVVGYFTLATAQVAFKEIPDENKGKLPKYPIPALRIARLAVSSECQGKGVGKWLLVQIFIKVTQVSAITGVYFLIVDAKESAKSFYEHFGFNKLIDKDSSYFLLVETIKLAMKK